MVADVAEPQIAPLPWAGQHRLWWRLFGLATLIMVLIVVSFEVVYADKVFPGVRADGVDLTDMSAAGAKAHLDDATTAYATSVLPVTYGKTTLHLPLNTFSLKYDTAKASQLAYGYGRTGSIWRRLHEQLRALVGHDTNFAAYTFADSQLTPYVNQVSDDVTTSVSNASLSFDNNRAQVTPATDGQRLDIGQFVLALEASFAATSTAPVAAPVYGLPAAVSTSELAVAVPQANADLSAPLELTYPGTSQTVTQATIAGWMKVTGQPGPAFIDSHELRDLYPQPTTAHLTLDQTAVTAYIAGLAANIDQTATNAQLAMQDGQLTIVKPSQDGVVLDQASAVSAIIAALPKTGDARTIALNVKTAQATVRADNLASLGITEQLSEGETYFPGSPSTRLINVRAGAAKFNNVLLAPGEVFSFGKLLGEVDASTGYVPELVILGDHEEKQYGGGLCQVSSTAFRAALAAGLPINERVNHAFAISYYTWPYSVPGLDATIYYPSVDFKFTNDTGHYLLMQTTMHGVDLKFDFYGTKTKSGVIRGPYFVSGSNDATQPSHTIFYRDVLDLAGNVIKTDTFNTYYQSSLNFPVQKQFN